MSVTARSQGSRRRSERRRREDQSSRLWCGLSCCRRRLRGFGAGLLGFAVHRTLELAARGEAHDLRGCDGDRLAGPQVAAMALAAFLRLEAAEARKLDVVALFHGGGDGAAKRFDGAARRRAVDSRYAAG